MASRFWVGGSANWDATAGTKWAATSGGAGGESVPTSADDVYFDAASGTVTVTATSATCKNITCTGFTGTLTGSVNINIYGDATLASTMNNLGANLSLTFLGTAASILTTVGKSVPYLTINRTGAGQVGLADALLVATTFTVTAGTFTTNDYNVTAPSLSSSNSNTRTINLGSSTVTLSASSGAINFTTNTNLTFNAGTSSIVLTNASATFAGGSQTFNDVSFTSTSGSTHTLSNNSTFNNLSFAGRTSAGIASVQIGAGQTINGTLTLSAGANATCRTFVRSNTIGETRTLTCAAVASLTDIDFRDITIAGAAAPVSGTRLGDCKGNSGITFDAAKTVYWTLGVSADWGGSPGARWATSSGGTPAVANFPLAQDVAVIDNGGLPSGSTITINAAYNIGTIDMSARTSNTMTLACALSPSIYGNWINGTGTTLSGTGTLTFAGRGSQTITSAGRTFTQSFVIQTPSGTVSLQDAFSSNRDNGAAFTIIAGTFDANGYNTTFSGSLSGFRLDQGGTVTRGASLGSGTLTVAGTGGFNASVATGVTVTGTGTISLTSASAKTFAGGGIQTYPTINQGGTGTLTITGSNKFADITNTAIGRVQFTGGTTNEFTAFNLNGVSGNLLQVGSTNTTQVTLKAPSWNVGANSTDAGNNTGLTFSAGSVDYLSISYVNGELTAAPVISVFIIESATGSSSESPIGTYNPVISELATGSEALTASGVLFGTLNESATAADVAEALRAFLADVSESATSSDLLAASLTLVATISELTTATDSAAVTSRVTNPTISEAAQMADLLAGGLLFLSDISEATTAQELAAAITAFTRAVLESAQGADAAQVAASTFSAASVETAVPLDTLQGANTGSSSLSESATVSDAAATAFVPSTAISEASTAQESASSLAVLSGPIVEAAALADTTSVAPSVFSAVALAAAQAAESFNPAGSIYNANAAVSVVAVDALRRSKLRVVDIEAFVSTGADVTAMTAEATVTGNTVSGTVESGPITATVLP